MSSEKLTNVPHYKVDFKNVKRSVIKTAEELHYSDDVISKLYLATTESELTRIMRNARQNKR
jgi:hypothetical protein